MATRSLLAATVSLAVPPRCAICAARCRPESPLCPACDRAIAATQPGITAAPLLDAVWSATAYRDTPRRLVAALKFHNRLPLARRAAEAIAASAPPDLLTGGAIVPVPPDPWRLRVRGHDPAEEIAYALARHTDLPFHPCLARATGPRQVGRARDARLADPPRIRVTRRPPLRAVLIDDVLTTGSTLAACAAALRRSGSVRVVAATFARA